MFNRKLVPTNRCRTWVNLKSYTELWIWVWISSANKCNIFVTLGLDCNRVDRSQNGTCNAELSSIKPESRESIQSKITEPACAEFWAKQVGNPAKEDAISLSISRHMDESITKYLGSQIIFGFFISYLWREWFDQNLEFFFHQVKCSCKNTIQNMFLDFNVLYQIAR